MKKRLSLVLASLLILSTFAACSGADTRSMPASESETYDNVSAVADDMAVPEEAPASLEEKGMATGGGAEDSGTDQAPDIQERKLVYTTDLSLETTDFEKDTQSVRQLVEKHGGYIENMYEQGQSLTSDYQTRYANYTARIPVSDSDSFIQEIEGVFHVRDTRQYVEDISKSYYDTETWLKTQEERLEHLQELLDGADDLEQMLTIEKEMALTRNEIQLTYNMMEQMKTQVNYATFNIGIEEVRQHSSSPTDKSFGERIRAAFSGSWGRFALAMQDFAVGLVAVLPFLLAVALIAAAVVYLVRRKVRKKSAEPTEAHQHAPEDSADSPTSKE